MPRRLLILAGALWLACAGAASAQAPRVHEMRLAYYIGDQHPMSQWLIRWSERLERESGGRIVVRRFPGAQMGPAPVHYDLARTGQADVTWFLTGGTPGRFPLTELINLPYLVGSAEIGTRVLNDPELRRQFLDAEYRGVRVLLNFTHQPGQIFTTRTPVRTVEDLRGLRLRFASPVIRDFIQALGATPVGVSPTDFLDQLQKGAIDGGLIDYGGAGIALRLGGTVRYVTETYAFVTSFGLAMNPAFYDRLPDDLKQLIDRSVTGVEQEIGRAWDALDAPGRQAILAGGATAIRLTPEEDARFRRIGAEVSERTIAQLESRGLPARRVAEMMRALAERHAADSHSFWR